MTPAAVQPLTRTSPTHEAPMPPACTTALAVHTEALEPTLNILARAHTARRLIATIHAATTQLAELAAAAEAEARGIAGFLDPIETTLKHAERTGTYAAVPIGNVKTVSHRIRTAIDCLREPQRSAEHQAARGTLHEIFATFGSVVTEPAGSYAERIGSKRRPTLTAEYEAWSA